MSIGLFKLIKVRRVLCCCSGVLVMNTEEMFKRYWVLCQGLLTTVLLGEAESVVSFLQGLQG